MEWSFRYSGPLARTDDRDCPVCTAAATKRCREHGTSEPGCAKCAAAGGAGCQAHQGLEAALKGHGTILHETDHGAVQWRKAQPSEGDRGKRQERGVSPKASDAAVNQFAAAGTFVLAMLGKLGDGAFVEVSMRGDADLPGANPMNLHVEAKVL